MCILLFRWSLEEILNLHWRYVTCMAINILYSMSVKPIEHEFKICMYFTYYDKVVHCTDKSAHCGGCVFGIKHVILFTIGHSMSKQMILWWIKSESVGQNPLALNTVLLWTLSTINMKTLVNGKWVMIIKESNCPCTMIME